MENVEHTPVKVRGQVVGQATVDLTDEGAIISMKLNHTEAGREIWDMLNDLTIGYSFEDEAEDHEDTEDDRTFQQDLTSVINRHSRENESGTPDFILAAYLEACLETFERTVQARAAFRGEQVLYEPTLKIIDEID